MASGTRLKNVHLGVVPPGGSLQHVSLVKGDYEYWHYCCDDMDDRGWGCGYRTLQTVCSWIRLQQLQSSTSWEASSNSLQNKDCAQNTVNRNIAHGVLNTSVDDKKDDVISVIGCGDINTHGDVIDDKKDDVISVIGCGDINTHGDVISGNVNNVPAASALRCEANTSVVACGNDKNRMQDMTSSFSSDKAKSNRGSEEDADGIVVLSSGNTSTRSESETPDTGPSMGQENISETEKKCNGSNVRVVSSGSQNKSQDLNVSPVSVEAAENDPSQSADTKTAPRDVPSLPEIQKALVQMGDKPRHFVGSRQWMGSYEVCLCLDFFYDVPCKIVHISRGSELKQHLSALNAHFSTLGSPVMMGGDSDASSKGIVGVCVEPGALLVVDPHYSGKATSAESLQAAGWIKWVLLEDFHPTSFYNMCLPQLPARAS